METMINLIDLLKHEIMDLYSAEEQIIEALPAMIEKAKNPDLKKALREHLKITEDQKSRLDKVKNFFGEGDQQEGEDKKGFFSSLFGAGGEKCKGMEGLITEGNKVMMADISEEALDAAIIASAQKIEHYEISGYGTARAFARQLNLAQVETLLTETLNEEYEADDRLTDLAVGKLNTAAEEANGMEMSSGRRSRSKSSTSSNNSNGRSGSAKSGSSSKSNSKAQTKSGNSRGANNGSKSSSKSSSNRSANSSRSASSKGSGSSKSNSKGSSKGNNSKNKSGRKK